MIFMYSVVHLDNIRSQVCAFGLDKIVEDRYAIRFETGCV